MDGINALDPDFLAGLEFVDNGAPTVQADFVQDVTLIGSVAAFTCGYLRQSPAGVWYKETAFFARFPKEAIPPGIALTTRKLGLVEIIPMATRAVCSYLRH